MGPAAPHPPRTVYSLRLGRSLTADELAEREAERHARELRLQTIELREPGRDSARRLVLLEMQGADVRGVEVLR